MVLALAWPMAAAADSGDTGDTGDTADSGEASDSGDSAEEEPGYTLADRTKDSGGCGFGGSAAALMPGVLALALKARERRR